MGTHHRLARGRPHAPRVAHHNVPPPSAGPDPATRPRDRRVTPSLPQCRQPPSVPRRNPLRCARTHMDDEKHPHRDVPLLRPEALCISALPCMRYLTLLSLGHRRAALLLACVAMTSAAPETGGSTEPGNTSSASSRHLLAAARKPNVLLFIADDLGIGDIKASGYMDENGDSTTRVSTLSHTCITGPRGGVPKTVHPRALRPD